MIEDELHFQLMRAFHRSNQLVWESVAGLGLKRGQPKILEYLLDHDGALARDVSRGVLIDKSTMASLLTRLEAMGLVRREQGEGDRRTQHLYLTQEGREKAREVKAAVIQVNRRLEQVVSKDVGDDPETVLRALRAVANLDDGE